MPLTSSQLAWCAAVLGAGTVGYHAPPVVKKAKAYVAKAKGEPGKAAAPRAVVDRAPVRPAAPTVILDCPMPSVPAIDGSLEYRLEPAWSQPWPHGSYAVAQPPIGGGSGFFPPVAPRVPEPGAWVMLIAGFGLVGLSLRKRGTEHGTV